MFPAITDAFFDQGTYDRLSWIVQVVADPTPDPVFWAVCFYIEDHPELWGYVGLQTNGEYVVGRKVAIFSLFGAVSALPGTTKFGTAIANTFPSEADGGEGVGGQRMLIPFPWREGRRHKLDVALDASVVCARVDGNVIGYAKLPIVGRLRGYMLAMTERYGPSSRPAVARFEQLRADKLKPWSVTSRTDGGAVVGTRRGVEHWAPV